MRFVLRPRCFSLALCLWPCWTASTVPMMAGQAAIAVRMPKTMMCIVLERCACAENWMQLRWSLDQLNRVDGVQPMICAGALLPVRKQAGQTVAKLSVYGNLDGLSPLTRALRHPSRLMYQTCRCSPRRCVETNRILATVGEPFALTSYTSYTSGAPRLKLPDFVQPLRGMMPVRL
jgi:hypothetical protein